MVNEAAVELGDVAEGALALAQDGDGAEAAAVGPSAESPDASGSGSKGSFA